MTEALLAKVVEPGDSESQEQFVSRCMGAEAESFPDEKQRAAVCYSKWRQAKKVSLTYSTSEIAKVDESLGLVFGWGIICSENGQPYYDLQGDHIPEPAMLEAVSDFMQKSRVAGRMHEREGEQAIADGTVVFSFPLTEEVAKAFGLVSARTGWMVAIKPSPDVLEKFRSGFYKGFSIGGSRVAETVVEP